MTYIIFDLEFNQDFSSLQNFVPNVSRYPFEIIQIGAIKLDEQLNTLETFNTYVKPTFYGAINSFITELTSITMNQLIREETFPSVYKNYMDFIQTKEAIFIIWGMSDIKELFRNVNYHALENDLLPRQFINIQPYVSKYLGLSAKKLLKLEDATNQLQIPILVPFHNALNDAYYTAEIFKKIYTPIIKPTYYDPTYSPQRPPKPRQKVDFEKLISQFEKMYDREMTEEEKSIIKLAYNMGKTHQFLT